ncbi:TPA: helix-turn-helix domain-containing protein [Serratia fonticola]
MEIKSIEEEGRLGSKVREIREAEGLSREEFSALTGVPAGSLKRYETERIKSIGSNFLLKITRNGKFKKYTLWLMTDDIAPEIGQISPALQAGKRTACVGCSERMGRSDDQ